jgi:glucokinase
MSRARALGIDIGGSRLRAALVDPSGTILARTETITNASAGPETVIAQVVDLVTTVASPADRSALAGAGVACPGPLDTATGRALGIPTLSGFADFPLAARLEAALGLPVALENDGIAAAIGEWQFGAGRGLDNIVYITVSTGIGGGIIADGKPLRGRMGMAGHVGHMTIMRDGEACPCGSHGCWEAYASGTAFTRRIRSVAPDALPATIFAAAREGYTAAQALVAEEADWLGIGITNLLHLYSPQCVVIGGGISNGFALLEPGIRARIQRNAMAAFRDIPIVVAGLGENAGLVGAASLVQ